MKALRTLLALGIVATAAACSYELRGNDDTVRTSVAVGIDEATKTTFGPAGEGGKRPIYWTDGDQLAINGVASLPLEGMEPASGNAVFHFTGLLNQPYSMLYPASIYTDASTVTLPRKVVNEKIPLGGKGQSVKALSAVVRLNIVKGSTPATIKKIELSTGNTQLCGPFSIDYEAATISGTDPSEANRSLEMSVSGTLSAETLSYYIPVPEGTYGFKVCVTDSEGRYMEKQTTSDKTFTRGRINSMEVFAFEPSGTRICLVEDNVQQYAVTIPVNATSIERVVATKIAKSLGTLTGTTLGVTTFGSSSDTKEIRVGLDGGAVSAQYGTLTYGSYTLRRDGNKILVGALDLNAYSAAANYLDKCFTDRYSNGDLYLEEQDLKDGSISSVKGYVPPFLPGKTPTNILQTGANCDKDVAMQVEFSPCSDTDFDSYCSAMDAAGYEKKCENAFGKCRFASYIGNGHQVSVALYNATRMLRIVGEPAYDKPIWSIEGTPGNVKTKMMQVCQDNVKIVPKSHPEALIVTLSDGRYFIYDTGTASAADQLMDYMRSHNTFTDGKVHIAMIIISHPHYDHMGGIGEFASRYASEIVCEAVGFNMTNHTRQSLYTLSTLHGRLNEIINAAKKLGATPYCLRAGQVVNLAGAKLEVIFTPDELGTYFLSGLDPDGNSSTAYDQNNSSNIVRLTVGGQKITFTGDCRGGEAGIFNNTVKSGFESDIMTAAHHGFNVSATVQMYTQAQPSVIFWPVRQDEQDMTRYFDQALMEMACVKKHFFEETQVEISLPYSVKD